MFAAAVGIVNAHRRERMVRAGYLDGQRAVSSAEYVPQEACHGTKQSLSLALFFNLSFFSPRLTPSDSFFCKSAWLSLRSYSGETRREPRVEGAKKFAPVLMAGPSTFEQAEINPDLQIPNGHSGRLLA